MELFCKDTKKVFDKLFEPYEMLLYIKNGSAIKRVGMPKYVAEEKSAKIRAANKDAPKDKRKKTITRYTTYAGYKALRGVVPSRYIYRLEKDSKGNPRRDENGNEIYSKELRERVTLNTVAYYMEEKYKFMSAPFLNTWMSAPLKQVIYDIINHLNSKNSRDMKRILNSAIAAVRLPMLRNDAHAHNADSTKKAKGFDHPMLATGQLLKSIACRFTKGDPK